VRSANPIPYRGVDARGVRAVGGGGDGERVVGVGGGAVYHASFGDGEATRVERLRGGLYPDAPHAAPLQRRCDRVELRH
jgi:hypothetical protein